MFDNKIIQFISLLFCLLTMLGVTSTSSIAQNVVTKIELPLLEKMTTELNREFVAGSIRANETAELALNKVNRVQTALQNFVHDKELQCQDNFFVTACFDDLRLKRRQVQEVLRRISAEANAFLRKARAARFESKSEAKNTKAENSE